MKLIKIFSLLLLTVTLPLLQSCDNAGCIDPNSLNYDPEATEDDGKCEYPSLTLNFNYKIGDTDLTKDNTYNINGTAVSFEAVQFYVANPRVA